MNGFQPSSSNAPTIGGLLAPARSQHNRAVSLPVFAQQLNGNGAQVENEQQRGRGHQYQSSFSGGLGNGSLYGLAIQDGMGMNGHGHGLNGWAEEEVVGN